VSAVLLKRNIVVVSSLRRYKIQIIKRLQIMKEGRTSKVPLDGNNVKMNKLIIRSARGRCLIRVHKRKIKLRYGPKQF